MAFTGIDGNLFKSCNKCRSNRAAKGQTRCIEFDLDKSYESHEEFVDDISTFLEQHGTHEFDALCPSLRIRATLSSSVLLDNDISVGISTQTADRELKTNNIFDCTGYYFHMRRVNERQDGPRFNMSWSSSKERKFERDVSNIRRHEGFLGMLRFHITEEVCNYIKEQKYLPPRQIYWNLIQLADDPRFDKTELHTITRQQAYNVWLSLTKNQWERDNADDFRSAQLLVAEQDGYRLIEELPGPGVSLAFITPCFSNYEKYNRGKMTSMTWSRYLFPTFS
ncbi:hypothetical protein V1524DRAFT_418959 [Lipomyces starkeyi]